MEITGKITHILEARSGVSARTGSSWMMQSFVLETLEPGRQFPRRCVFEVFGEDKLRQFNIQAGEDLTVSIDIDAREYQGRWYNTIRAWRVDRVQIDPATGMPIPYTPAAPTTAPGVQPTAVAPATAAPVASAPVMGATAPEPVAEGEGGEDLPF